MPSVEEGLSRQQAQAMACGVPVIATPNTGSEDLFGDGKRASSCQRGMPGPFATAWSGLDHPAEGERMGGPPRSE